MRENSKKKQSLQETGREKSLGAGNRKFPSESIIPDSILMLPVAKSRLNEIKRSNAVKNRISYFFIFFGGVGGMGGALFNVYTRKKHAQRMPHASANYLKSNAFHQISRF